MAFVFARSCSSEGWTGVNDGEAGNFRHKVSRCWRTIMRNIKMWRERATLKGLLAFLAGRLIPGLIVDISIPQIRNCHLGPGYKRRQERQASNETCKVPSGPIERIAITRGLYNSTRYLYLELGSGWPSLSIPQFSNMEVFGYPFELLPRPCLCAACTR